MFCSSEVLPFWGVGNASQHCAAAVLFLCLSHPGLGSGDDPRVVSRGRALQAPR